jgi:hypothetical protein
VLYYLLTPCLMFLGLAVVAWIVGSVVWALARGVRRGMRAQAIGVEVFRTHHGRDPTPDELKEFVQMYAKLHERWFDLVQEQIGRGSPADVARRYMMVRWSISALEESDVDEYLGTDHETATMLSAIAERPFDECLFVVVATRESPDVLKDERIRGFVQTGMIERR